ncbi:hypothetical protein E4T66_18105 [Sinimarinibacterium sp. CAU 1509]|uniref:hypothetical protein n=1 Tax=Sinimarinibacterium sp. CAU 1509 TaxID=2562283 RepID=UPI0010AD07CA|nr:hypothetical protein [Sinimarinibacterium sp. CAU 1509]TJY57319.1 hypothetical protein E4T66_18105 [Sinimarinibacterium sp. CAU 1509]
MSENDLLGLGLLGAAMICGILAIRLDGWVRTRIAAVKRERAEAAARRADLEARRSRKRRWLLEVHLPFLNEHVSYFGSTMHRRAVSEKQAWRLRRVCAEHQLDLDAHALTSLEASSVIGMYEPPSEEDLQAAEYHGAEVADGMQKTEVRHAIALAKLGHDQMRPQQRRRRGASQERNSPSLSQELS